MTATDLSAQPEQRTDEPLYFPSGSRQLFGWLHWPQDARGNDMGLVICKPFGYEAVCAHRSLRAFAEAAVEVGIPALRFDYAGSGDSEDLPAGIEELSVWVDDVLAAAGELRRRAGVTRVAVLGVRLGALLATLAAERSQSLDALILVAPVINGRRYLRELRTVQLAASEFAVVAPPASTAGDDGREMEEGSFEVSGFAMSSATTMQLARTDLSVPERAPARQMLLIDRDDLPSAAAWSESLSRLGVDIEYVALSGIVPMVWTAPHFGTAPRAMITAARDWLARSNALAPAAPLRSRAQRVPHGGHHRSNVLTVPLWEAAQSPPVSQSPPTSQPVLTERPVFFASEPRRFGIVTEPSPAQARRRGVILLNDGATYHVGANRMNVSLARRWARGGYTVLRMDMAGLGESDARSGCPFDEVFPAGAIEDIRAAVHYLRTAHRCGDISVHGLCSGAYHALRSAMAGLPINRIMLVNPQNYFWNDATRIDDLQLSEIVRGPSRYRERLLSGKSWSKLLRGEANVRYILKVAIHHAWFVILTALRDGARHLRIRLSQDLGRELEEIVKRGIEVVFVFGRGEVGLELLRIEAGACLARLGERCRIHVIDGADHIFSQSRPRQALEGLLSRELFGLHRFRCEPDGVPLSDRAPVRL